MKKENKFLPKHSEEEKLERKIFHDIIDYLDKGDTLVLNNTKVLPARLIGEKEDTKAVIEVKTEQLNFLDKIPKPNEKPENSKESVGNFTKNRKTFCGEKNLPGQMRLNVTLPIKKL